MKDLETVMVKMTTFEKVLAVHGIINFIVAAVRAAKNGRAND